MSEAKLYTPILVASSRAGARLFRNNTGSGFQYVERPPKGWRPPDFLKPFTYGLPTGSADFVGWAPYVITAEDVGRTVAVFASIEAKDTGWHETPSWLGGDQAAWLRSVRASGGVAGVVTSAPDAVRFLQAGPFSNPHV